MFLFLPLHSLTFVYLLCLSTSVCLSYGILFYWGLDSLPHHNFVEVDGFLIYSFPISLFPLLHALNLIALSLQMLLDFFRLSGNDPNRSRFLNLIMEIRAGAVYM